MKEKEISTFDAREKTFNVKDLFKPGTKFRTTYDRDPWYVVDVIIDKDDVLVVYKSWTKYKQRWVYKVESAQCLIWTLCMMGQIFETKDGRYVIKDNPKYYGKN